MSAIDQTELESAQLIAGTCSFPLSVTYLQRGDVLLLQTPTKLHAEQRAALTLVVKRALGDQTEPLILDGDFGITVLRTAEAAADGVQAKPWDVLATGTAPTTPPPIGHLWAAQGGLYAGIARGAPGQPDHHLILAASAPDDRLPWQAAMDWTKGLQHRGHSDWALPTRAESALLYANLKAECVAEWHWTCETYGGDGSYAWGQDFYDGYQDNLR